jgi:hypothetical protein
MANRRYTANEQLRAKSDYGSRPAPGVGGESIARTKKESPVPYPGAPGPKGPGWKPARLGFNEVKTHVKQDLADDIYGNGPGSLGMPLPPTMMPISPMTGPEMNPSMPSINPLTGPQMNPAVMPPVITPMPRVMPIGRRFPVGLRGRRGANY